ncbi:MAG: DUF2238 domain-containing protein [Spirochaetes bacterium]|jgi:putative membrane protein|nr:DUF2238 domain-containing protein [Spirochaetota bacterium]
MSDRLVKWLLITSLVLITAWSVVFPKDLLTWFLEAFPVIIGALLLFFTQKNFRFTRLVYILLWVHAIILLVGAHYTYAENPLFEWIKIQMGLERNNYDRLGHLAQGFIPAMVARELILRTTPLQKGKWLFFIVTCICLAVSAFYEFIEWWAALLIGQSADSFLGTQGDVWDTQWDMFMAFTGSILSQLILSRMHDRALEK